MNTSQTWRVNELPEGFRDDNPAYGLIEGFSEHGNLNRNWRCFHCRTELNLFEIIQVHTPPAGSEVVCPDCADKYYPQVKRTKS